MFLTKRIDLCAILFFYKRVGDNHGSVISRASFFVSVEAAQQMSPVLVYLDDIYVAKRLNALSGPVR